MHPVKKERANPPQVLAWGVVCMGQLLRHQDTTRHLKHFAPVLGQISGS